jgi:2-oxoglutarate ferredoxin oxidoreductase subunit alpha
LPQLGGVVIQAEDEIASVAMAIGVSFAGYRAMSATAGPGLSLMTELLGLAGMAEIPLVIADIQRAGPSTGMPTKTEQSDLNLAVYGNHGEAPRIVLAPADVEDCFYSTITAFNLAEKYQLPVLILSDQSLSNRTESIPRPDLRKIEIFERAKWTGGGGDHYKRYKLTETGVSPMAHPGTPDGIHVACGLEHTESGRPNYDPVNHTKMVDKRFRKLQIAKADFPPVEVYGDPTAELGIISWGSTLGAVHEATERAREKGIRICSFYPRVLYPLGNGYLDRALENVKTLIVPEVNSQGQFATLLGRVYSGTVVRQNIYGGLPFRPQTILEKIEEVAETCQKPQLSTTRAR